jgi:hypothetical protein
MRFFFFFAIFLIFGNFVFAGGETETEAEASSFPSSGKASIGMPIEGTIVPGDTLAEKLAWLDRRADSHNTYFLVVNANENINPYTFEYKGAIDITIVLKGDEENRTVRLKSNGTMFTVNASVTFILDNNITLRGHSQNAGSMVSVKGGKFRMNDGAAVTGNDESNGTGGGVYVGEGIFEMTGGIISDNTAADSGGGVSVYSGTFRMFGGTISGNNTDSNGGGVYVEGGTFEMHNGIISGNTSKNGGGVFRGGQGKFAMREGTITSNIAREYGGGVYVQFGAGIFIKTGGTITGYNSDQINANMVKDDEGVLARRGHAVFSSFSSDQNYRKETTAEPGDNIGTNPQIGWDN